jgi:hypothetical protein
MTRERNCHPGKRQRARHSSNPPPPPAVFPTADSSPRFARFGMTRESNCHPEERQPPVSSRGASATRDLQWRTQTGGWPKPEKTPPRDHRKTLTGGNKVLTSTRCGNKNSSLCDKPRRFTGAAGGAGFCKLRSKVWSSSSATLVFVAVPHHLVAECDTGNRGCPVLRRGGDPRRLP